MATRSKKSDRKPTANARFLSQVLADNLRMSRTLLRLSQEEVSELMWQLGHDWKRATVSEVERNGRVVSIDEITSLALVLQRSIPDLLDPTGIDRRGTGDLDFGGPRKPHTFPAEAVSEWLRSDEITIRYVNGVIAVSGNESAWRVTAAFRNRKRPINNEEEEGTT